MRTAVEISLYPLDADYVPPIKDFIERLNRLSGPRRRDQRDEHAGGRRARTAVLPRSRRKRARRSRAERRAVFVMKVLGGTPTSDEG